MTDQYAMTPKQALAVIEAAGAEDAAKLIRDHAADGLIRSYAQLQVTIGLDGIRHDVRGGKVQPTTWERIIIAAADPDVWSGGTVRLPGSDLIGGTPAVHVTGVAFHPGDIDRLANQQQPTASGKHAKPVQVAPAIDSANRPQPVDPKRSRQTPDPSALHSGALLLTVAETKAALSISHTTFYKLLNAGDLERAPSKAGTRVTATSVRRYAGLAD